ncbi:endonuclease [Aliifodinibius salipaludis]|uniref:Endonuclease n=1 Tax=Fodinibius salipaludis TaxID=2032627 RepID=A0A2A2G734_9BACT|nr:GIY-YIG nuclease family protein [Aliifodinibius salipaludis]PAU93576.1 endonuclease [Aliifodinibius salipaludis]
MGYRNSTGKNGFVYILSNHSRNVIYTGVTSELDERILDHRFGKGSRFTSKYNLKVLLYFEKYPNIDEAIEREKQLKNWHREWKFNLIKKSNPELKDLWD